MLVVFSTHALSILVCGETDNPARLARMFCDSPSGPAQGRRALWDCSLCARTFACPHFSPVQSYRNTGRKRLLPGATKRSVV
jgi:ribosomal protein L37AE/L43A